jgi:type I site-specific restriction-modification system R (restriction) subunit
VVDIGASIMAGGYSEDSLVQQTTAEYLERELGWESVYAYNQETFGPEGTLGRTSDREVVLVRCLRAKLAEFNPGLPEDAYRDAIRQIVEYGLTQTLLATNREKYALLKDGVQVAFRNGKGELVKRRLRVFDFDEPENNHFLCVRELWVRGDLYRRRADIVGFVNGIPLLFMELKKVSRDIRTAFDDNLADYKDTVPHLSTTTPSSSWRTALMPSWDPCPAASSTSTNGSAWPRRSRAPSAWKPCSRGSAARAISWTSSRTSSSSTSPPGS